jgi:hypothetical protein
VSEEIAELTPENKIRSEEGQATWVSVCLKEYSRSGKRLAS